MLKLQFARAYVHVNHGNSQHVYGIALTMTLQSSYYKPYSVPTILCYTVIQVKIFSLKNNLFFLSNQKNNRRLNEPNSSCSRFMVVQRAFFHSFFFSFRFPFFLGGGSGGLGCQWIVEKDRPNIDVKRRRW